MAEIALHPFPSLDMEKSNERTVDGEKGKHMDHREHQIVNGHWSQGYQRLHYPTLGTW